MNVTSRWPAVPLGELVADTQYGTSVKANEEGVGVPVLRMGNITYSGALDLTDLKHVELPSKDLERYSVQRGDLLFNRTNSQELVGKMGVWDRDEPYAFAGYLVRLRLKRDVAEPAFVAAWFNTTEMKTLLRARGKPSINMSNINATEVLKFPVVLPPLPEQRRIAEVLDRAEALRAKRRAALAQLDDLTQAIFLDLFGDPVTNPKGWPKAMLGDTTEMVTGYPFRSEEYVTNGDSVRLCRGANILPGRVDWSDLARWPECKAGALAEFRLAVGDVVIAMDRPWISEGFKIARVQPEDCPALLVQRVARLRGKKEMPNAFLFHLLNQPAFTHHCRPTETTIPHISPKDIRSFTFPLPPITLQREFARRVSAVEALKVAQRASLAELDALFASLQHRAFRGEL